MTVRHLRRDLHPGRHVNQAPFPGFPGAQRKWGRRTDIACAASRGPARCTARSSGRGPGVNPL